MENVHAQNNGSSNPAILFTKERGIKRHKELSSALKYLSWKHKVQAIKSAAGDDLDAEFDLKKDSAPVDSIFTDLGFDSLKTFITTPEESYGLGIEWSEWQKLAEAAGYAEKYAIEGTPDSVISQVKEVIKHVRKVPHNAADYHRAFMSLKETQFQAERERNVKNEQGYKQKITYLVNIIKKSSQELADLKEANELLTSASNYPDMIHKDELQKIQEELECTSQKERAATQRLVDAQAAIERLNRDIESQQQRIDELAREAKNNLNAAPELAEQLKNANDRYERSDSSRHPHSARERCRAGTDQRNRRKNGDSGERKRTAQG